jgi:hypothetical protein
MIMEKNLKMDWLFHRVVKHRFMRVTQRLPPLTPERYPFRSL